ncbi:dual specificity protein phosphatase 22-B-like [Littorina saxatilis]|uniref:Dual specificity protein phosphatase 15 n=1 Tax=Littorina saxatilis TaxID=31220 RepID=A0AAN9BYG5_9CAEN
MGGAMSEILPGLYVGNIRDAQGKEKLEANNITHILSIHDNAKELIPDKKYLCIVAGDNPHQDLMQFFPQCIDFIHQARLSGGSVLVHCLAGVSRSVTVTAAYMMTATSLGWRDAINAIRGARNQANPNFGFQKQLQRYENEELEKARQKFKEKYPENKFNDEADCKQLLRCFKHFVQTGESTTNATSVPKDEHDGLYPLPPNAYSSNRHCKLDPDTVPELNAAGSEGTASAEAVTSNAASPQAGQSD